MNDFADFSIFVRFYLFAALDLIFGSAWTPNGHQTTPLRRQNRVYQKIQLFGVYALSRIFTRRYLGSNLERIMECESFGAAAEVSLAS